MIVVAGRKFKEFQLKPPQSRTSLDSWHRIMCALRETFPSADIVNDRIIFHISGNKYRLIATIDFTRRLVKVTNVLTHAQYDRERF